MLEAWGNQGTVVGGEWFWSDTREVAAGIPRLSLPGHCWRLAATMTVRTRRPRVRILPCAALDIFLSLARPVFSSEKWAPRRLPWANHTECLIVPRVWRTQGAPRRREGEDVRGLAPRDCRCPQLRPLRLPGLAPYSLSCPVPGFCLV